LQQATDLKKKRSFKKKEKNNQFTDFYIKSMCFETLEVQIGSHNSTPQNIEYSTTPPLLPREVKLLKVIMCPASEPASSQGECEAS